MNKFSGVAVLIGLAVSGCATKTPEKPTVAPSPVVSEQYPATPLSTPARQAPTPAVTTSDAPASFSSSAAQPEPAANENQLRVQQCRKEIDTMKLYNKASYDKYESEFQVIASKVNKYMQIKDAIGSDINDMVMPGYQFKMREFCFRVKTRLSQLIIRQAH